MGMFGQALGAVAGAFVAFQWILPSISTSEALIGNVISAVVTALAVAVGYLVGQFLPV